MGKCIASRIVGYEERLGEKRRVLEQLSCIARANAKAHAVAPVAPEVIARLMSSLAPQDVELGANVAGQMHYHCYNRKDFLEAEKGGLKALAAILEAMLWAVADLLPPKRGAQPKQQGVLALEEQDAQVRR